MERIVNVILTFTKLPTMSFGPFHNPLFTVIAQTC
jgi:hypothetical protein